MHVNKIEWLDKTSKEAIVEVSEGTEQLICFSCSCPYKRNDRLCEPLECLDTRHVTLCFVEKYDIKKLEGVFCYKLKGQIKDKNRGLVDVYGFILHIDQQEIPNDIESGMYIEFTTSRIDLW